MSQTATFPIVIDVPGVPAPGGSKKAFANPRTGKIIVKDDAVNNKGWRATVALAGRLACPGAPLACPLRVSMTFRVLRPRGHYGTGRNAGTVKASAPAVPATRPDVLKLARSTEDALTGIIWVDDSQTTRLELEKVYGDSPGVRIVVEPA